MILAAGWVQKNPQVLWSWLEHSPQYFDSHTSPVWCKPLPSYHIHIWPHPLSSPVPTSRQSSMDTSEDKIRKLREEVVKGWSPWQCTHIFCIGSGRWGTETEQRGNWQYLCPYMELTYAHTWSWPMTIYGASWQCRCNNHLPCLLG